MKKQLITIAALVLATSASAFAKSGDCSAQAATAAMHLEMFNNSVADDAVNVRQSVKIKSIPSGGETLDVYKVWLVINEDQAAFYEAKVYSSACLVKSVEYKTGD